MSSHQPFFSNDNSIELAAAAVDFVEPFVKANHNLNGGSCHSICTILCIVL